VLSSLSEGFPNVLAEAMALGLPVIATNCRSGPAEILRKDCDYEAVTDTYAECDYGILTPEMTDGYNQNAISQLAAAISALMGDPEKRKTYGALAKERAGDFSSQAMKTKLEEIFCELQRRK
jgi:glycosyltransferase involved in cell wall biosynthesis